jgi:microcystin-dependent protein
MCDPFIGQIVLFAGNFAPRGWQYCHGQLMAIQDNQSLFSILGATYGGDGRTTFALPDLRGRVPLGAGSGPGLTSRRLGGEGGKEAVTLMVAEMPNHNHIATGSQFEGDRTVPVEAVPSRSPLRDLQYASSPDSEMHPEAVQPAGGSQAHENMQPFLGLNYIIAVTGIYPPRP